LHVLTRGCVADCNCGGTRRAHGSCCWTSWQETGTDVWHARSWVCKFFLCFYFERDILVI